MADKAASVLAKLRNKAKASGISYQQCLQLFVQEEFLRKLSKSGYGDTLILKGGLFIYTLTNFESRATIDVDFLLRGYPNSIEDIKDLIGKIIDTPTGNDYITMTAQCFYEELQVLLADMKRDSGAEYLYLFYPEEDHFTYILDARAGRDGEVISQLGDVYEYGETEYQYLVPDVQAKRASQQIIMGQDVGYGRSVSAWAPILNRDGDLVAMAEVDFYLEQVGREATTYVLRFIVVMLLGSMVILFILLRFNNRRLIKPLQELTKVIASYKDGKFQAEEWEFLNRDEMQELYDTYIQMVDKMDTYVENITKITAEKERIGTELNVATQIQADMLPSIFPAFPDRSEIDIYAVMQPAREVGGDFYDFFWIDDDHLAFLIADVSGKGVPAALFMVIAKTIIKNHMMNGNSVEKVLELVNHQLCEGNEESFFVTAWLGILNIQTGLVEYANAGHNPPIHLHGDTGTYVAGDTGLVLAAMDGMTYTKEQLQLEPGDRILLYTDGVTESVTGDMRAYGEERLLDMVKETRGICPQEAVVFIKKDIEEFVGEAEQFDDITMLLLELEPR